MSESRNHAERSDAGAAVMRTLSGSADNLEQLQERLSHLGALGSFAQTFVAGEVWARDQLSRRDRSLITLGMMAAFGRADEVGFHAESGLVHGLTRDEIDEVMVQVAAYAGFPCGLLGQEAVNATFARLDGVESRGPLEPAEAKDGAQRRADGADVMGTLTGRAMADPDAAAEAATAGIGEVGRMAVDFAFGEVWSRGALSRRDRSLLVVSILAALSKPAELDMHIPGALNHGVTREEVEEVMVHLVAYGGFPRAVEGMQTARRIFARLDGAAE